MNTVAIIGAGESGVGAALLAKKNELEVFVSDYGKIREDYKEELLRNNIPFEEEGHSFEKLEKADVIVKSPGIPGTAEVIRYFRLRHKEIISEIEFASRFYDGKIIGITGSNGKTTTTKLCHHILENSGINCAQAGNVGYSFARLLTMDANYDWIVLELSSFQLDDINTFSSEFSVILNITPDHLDRYDYNFNNYAKSKWNLALATKSEGLLVLNRSNEIQNVLIKEFPVECKVLWLENKDRKQLVSMETGDYFEMQIRGWHNAYNASVAVLIARRLGISDTDIDLALQTFEPVEHRMELVASYRGIEYINDSKSTNVDSCLVGLDSINGKLVWIAGGVDKGNDYAQLDKALEGKLEGLVCLTTDDKKLRSHFSYLEDRILTTENMDEAVRWAAERVGEGTVLLSPACASFDLFDNYEHRGKSFKDSVIKYLDDFDQ